MSDCFYKNLVQTLERRILNTPRKQYFFSSIFWYALHFSTSCPTYRNALSQVICGIHQFVKTGLYRFEFAENITAVLCQCSVQLRSRKILKRLRKKRLKGQKWENVNCIISVTALQTGLIFVVNSVQEGLIDIDMVFVF